MPTAFSLSSMFPLPLDNLRDVKKKQQQQQQLSAAPQQKFAGPKKGGRRREGKLTTSLFIIHLATCAGIPWAWLTCHAKSSKSVELVVGIKRREREREKNRWKSYKPSREPDHFLQKIHFILVSFLPSIVSKSMVVAKSEKENLSKRDWRSWGLCCLSFTYRCRSDSSLVFSRYIPRSLGCCASASKWRCCCSGATCARGSTLTRGAYGWTLPWLLQNIDSRPLSTCLATFPLLCSSGSFLHCVFVVFQCLPPLIGKRETKRKKNWWQTNKGGSKGDALRFGSSEDYS